MRFTAALLALIVAPSLGAAMPRSRAEMIRIPAGTYRPLYGATTAKVEAFRIDRDPVTRDDYLGWLDRSSRVNARRPMTNVTWQEAKTYCEQRGARLPSLAEWEYVAAASRTSRNATADPSFAQVLVSIYASRKPGASVDAGSVNAYGVRGLHDLVWEWVADPNEALAAAHHAHMHHDAKSGHDMSCAGAALGAADPRDYAGFLRAAVRSGLTESTRMSSLGFRCAR
jgi:formylglycine-generating enzyme